MDTHCGRVQQPCGHPHERHVAQGMGTQSSRRIDAGGVQRLLGRATCIQSREAGRWGIGECGLAEVGRHLVPDDMAVENSVGRVRGGQRRVVGLAFAVDEVDGLRGVARVFPSSVLAEEDPAVRHVDSEHEHVTGHPCEAAGETSVVLASVARCVPADAGRTECAKLDIEGDGLVLGEAQGSSSCRAQDVDRDFEILLLAGDDRNGRQDNGVRRGAGCLLDHGGGGAGDGQVGVLAPSIPDRKGLLDDRRRAHDRRMDARRGNDLVVATGHDRHSDSGDADDGRRVEDQRWRDKGTLDFNAATVDLIERYGPVDRHVHAHAAVVQRRELGGVIPIDDISADLLDAGRRGSPQGQGTAGEVAVGVGENLAARLGGGAYERDGRTACLGVEEAVALHTRHTEDRDHALVRVLVRLEDAHVDGRAGRGGQ